MNPLETARKFIAEETQFQLGFLVTESSHPRTKNLSETIAASTAAGVRQLLSVDRDIAAVLPAQLRSETFALLVSALTAAASAGRTIVFSGCGSTGRLAVLLELMWRRFWVEAAERGVISPCPETAQRVRGIITGGDRALVRSVENFEDYEEFGREQVRELSLERNDLFIAISEGGETSSVIGTAHEALDRGCRVFFVYNNPTELLTARIERSRRLITRAGLTPVDLTTGPMALSGSTRMQATTSELLFVGIAMEEAICSVLSPSGRSTLGLAPRSADDWGAHFRALLDELDSGQCVQALADLVETEAGIYSHGGIVAYASDRFLLDIFADTTERTPTFSIPALKRRDAAADAPNPWAIAYLPGARGPDAWCRMLGREPVGLDWSSERFRRLGAPTIAETPPVLDASEIVSYPVGDDALDLYGSRIELTTRIIVDRDGVTITAAERGRRLVPALPPSGLEIFHHVAVKLILNTLSTATMAYMRRVRGNWMIQVSPTNKKLIDRSVRIIADLSGLDYETAARRFFAAHADRRVGSRSLVSDILDGR
ncbi:MAG: sugar phosphate isomerase [Spirochaetaceae bacterium]|nr:MAG: sugar phosphate isomerase [Spirochaetaceae bacterium]